METKYWNKEIETMPRKKLERLINKKLRHTIRYAYEFSPFYHRLFDDLNLKPEDIKDQNELLKKLPIITRTHIIENQPPKTEDFLFFSAPIGLGYTRPYSSGSRGEPKICRRTFDDWDVSREACARAYVMAGIDEKDVVLNILPFGVNVSGLASLFGFYRTVGAEVITAGTATYPSKVDLIKVHKPTVLFGMPSYIDRLSRELELAGISPQNVGIKKILAVGEPCVEEKKKKFEETFNAEVYRIYASDEGDVMASECKAHNGLHVREDYCLLHAIDIEDKEILSEGEEGADLLTTLVDNGKYHGMVLLNFHHGDKFKILSYEKCECGRTHKRISHPTREGDEVSIGPAKLPFSDIEAVINRPEYRKYLTGEYEIIKKFDEVERIYHVTIRMDVKGKVDDIPSTLKDKIKTEIYKINYPIYVVTQPGQIGTLEIQLTNEGELEVYKKTGKPSSRRLIVL